MWTEEGEEESEMTCSERLQVDCQGNVKLPSCKRKISLRTNVKIASMWWMMMLVDNFLPGGAARRSRGRSSSYSYRWTILNIGKCRRFLINLFSDPPEPPSSPRETDLPGDNQFHCRISLTFLGSWRLKGFKSHSSLSHPGRIMTWTSCSSSWWSLSSSWQ